MKKFSLCVLLAACATKPSKPPPAAAQEAEDTTVAPAGKTVAAPPVGSAIIIKAAPTVVATENPATPVPKSLPAKVKIIVHSTPHAAIYWGKKKLGETPFNFDRPRNSGPVDLVLRVEGYVPLHTRAYSVHNDVISVRLTKLEEKQNLFGAKKEILPPPDPDPAAATGAAATGAVADPGAPVAPAIPTNPAPQK